MSTGTRAAVLGGARRGVRHAEHRPADHRCGQAWPWKQPTPSASPGATSASTSARTKANIPTLAGLEPARGVCAIKVFAGSSTGDLLIEDDASIATRHARRASSHRLSQRRRIPPAGPQGRGFIRGDPYASHMDWRDEETAFLGTRRLMALARRHRPAGAYPACLDGAGTRLSEGFPRHRHLRGAGQPPDADGARLLRTARRLRRDEPADPRRAAPGSGLGGGARRHGGLCRLGPRAASAGGEGKALAGVPFRPYRRADFGAGHAGPCECRPVVARAHGGCDVRGTGAGLWRGRQRAAGVRLRRRFHPCGHGPRRRIEESWIVSPCGWTPFAEKQVTGWPVATIIRGQAVMREDEVLGAPRGRLVRFSG